MGAADRGSRRSARRRDVRGGRVVVGVGAGHAGARRPGPRGADLPALVNAHTHLELSHLHGRCRSARPSSHWVRALLALRRGHAGAIPDRGGRRPRRALASAVASGTGLFGDVSNTRTTPAPSSHAARPGVVFHELLGFRGDGRRRRLAAAAPGCEPAGRRRRPGEPGAARAVLGVTGAVSRHPASSSTRRPARATTVHLAESPEEVEFMRDGTGPWRTMLEDFGVWDASWQPAGCRRSSTSRRSACSTTAVLAVHGVQCSPDDVRRLAASGATIVVCPRSNRAVGVGDAPIDGVLRGRRPVAIGTDSLASAPDLNCSRRWPPSGRWRRRWPARAILDSATRVGRRGAGLWRDHGAHRGRRRGRAHRRRACRHRRTCDDVEEYLVSGVAPDRVAWVWPAPAPSRAA